MTKTALDEWMSGFRHSWIENSHQNSKVVFGLGEGEGNG